MNEKYLNKIIIFERETGCIPKDARCYCYSLEGDYLWVCFSRPIFGRNDLKIHSDVIRKHGKITGH